MLAPPQRPKRPRSPSPASEPSLASPLDVLLKRRRREQQHSNDYAGSPLLESPGHGYEQDYFAHHSSMEAESSSAAQMKGAGGESGVERGVERRRTRQWDRINAPLPGSQHSHQYHPHPHALATPGPDISSGPVASSGFPFPPNQYSSAHTMSSSPIRNHPPSSSPFREKGEAPDEMGCMMNEEEMRREWGEAYTEQNSLLHSLHLARISGSIHRKGMSSPVSHPSHPSHPSHSYRTPLASSSTLFSPPQTSPYPYGDSLSSPYTPARPIPRFHPQSHTSYVSEDMHKGGDGEDLDMALERTEEENEAEEEVKTRYEETNRLLGQLAVVRRERWGEDPDV